MARVSAGLCLLLAIAPVALGREPGDPIRLDWTEGDVAGFSAIYDAVGGGSIGRIEYHQRRRGALLQTVRVARFADGSSDEDRAVARVGAVLEAVRGWSIMRDPTGRVTVELQIDVPEGRLRGFAPNATGSSGCPAGASCWPSTTARTRSPGTVPTSSRPAFSTRTHPVSCTAWPTTD